ncbi:hypothetical protein EU96_1751 [Prochlorococcus marinus str. MIT 9302]|uniref:Uncharacterized protein n=1 Tax=Prochlorococcus marinus str. MIT 9302 TaxID=74545 RepID=A0A0A2A6A7_PROMR|nr:hypothetical protein EU96_1751 [Prochlorococcus marinus str. MIT 9302]
MDNEFILKNLPKLYSNPIFLPSSLDINKKVLANAKKSV